MRHIYRIYPDQTYNTINGSISDTKSKYARLCSEQGITVSGVNYKMSVDDIALLYRQPSANATLLSPDAYICFAVSFGDVGMLSIDDCVSKTRIVNVTDDDIIDGQITLEDSIRYIIKNPSSAITFVIPDTTSEYVQSYEIYLTMGENSVNMIFPENIQWISNHPIFESNKSYLICIDGNLGLYTKIDEINENISIWLEDLRN